MNLRSSKYLATNLGYLSGFQGVIALALYSDQEYVVGDSAHKPVLDAIRSLLLTSSEKCCDATIGGITYRAQRLGDDEYVVAWKKGHPIGKSLMRAIDRAVERPHGRRPEVAA